MRKILYLDNLLLELSILKKRYMSSELSRYWAFLKESSYQYQMLEHIADCLDQVANSESTATHSLADLKENILELRKNAPYPKNVQLSKISEEDRFVYNVCDQVLHDIQLLNTIKCLTAPTASLSRIDSDIKALESKLQTLQEEHKIVSHKVQHQQQEYVVILSIFAAVVLAFVASLVFSSSVLNNIGSASLFRLTTVALIIGLVSINLIFGLLHYINNLVQLDETAKNSYRDPLCVANITFVLFFIITVILQRIGWLN